MILQLNEKVDVVVICKESFLPYKIKWKNKVYQNLKLGYHHKTKIGNIIHHIFSVATDSLALRLNFDTDNLSWTLEEISDGFAN